MLAENAAVRREVSSTAKHTLQLKTGVTRHQRKTAWTLLLLFLYNCKVYERNVFEYLDPPLNLTRDFTNWMWRLIGFIGA